MKKYILLLLVGSSVFAQEVEQQHEIVWTRDIRHMGGIEYIQFTKVENDSLQRERRVSNFAETNTSVTQELEAIKATDSLTNEYIYHNNKQNTLFYAIYENNNVLEGLVLDSLAFSKDKPIYKLYKDRQVIKSYQFDLDKHYLSFLEASATNNKEKLDYFYNLPIGAIAPIAFSDEDDKLTTEKGFILLDANSTFGKLEYRFSETDDQLDIRITKNQVVDYYIVRRDGTMITINNISYDKQTREEGYLNKATIVNVGFEQKRTTTVTEKGKGIWDAYLEDFLLQDWKAKGQIVYDFKRGNEKKPLHMRIITGTNIDRESFFYDLVLSFTNNPELFRKDLNLKDFDYTTVSSKQFLSLKTDKKHRYQLLN